jgi:hypothetical protein
LIPAQVLIALVALVILLVGPDRENLMTAIREGFLAWIILAAVVLVAGGVVAAIISLRGHFGLSILAMGVLAVVVIPTIVALAPRIATDRTSERLCRRFADLLAAADIVIHSESEDYSVPLTLGRRVAIVGRARELGVGFLFQTMPPPMAIPEDPYDIEAPLVESPYLLTRDDVAELLASERLVCLFADDKFLEKFDRLPEDVRRLGTNSDITLLANRTVLTDRPTSPSRPLSWP